MTFELVARRHGRTIETLQIYNIANEDFDCEPKLSALTSLDLGDIDPCAETFWASKIVAHNQESLSNLKLGCERETALSYLGKGDPMGVGKASNFTKNFGSAIRRYLLHETGRNGKDEAAAEASPSILTVKLIHLIGFDCSSIGQLGSRLSIVNIDDIAPLCLESCFHLGQQRFFTLFSRQNPDAPPLLP